MRNIKLFFYFIFIFHLKMEMNAQAIHDSIHNNHNWAINVTVAPQYNYRLSYHKSGYNGPMQNGSSYVTSDQIGKAGFNVGISVSRRIFRNFYFQTGLIIDKKGYDSKPFYDTVVNGRPSITSTEISSEGFNFVFIGIPVFVSYEKNISEYWSIAVTTGVTSNFREHGKEYRSQQLEGEIEFPSEKFINWQLIAYGKVGFLYASKPNMSISISPFFNCCLQPMTDYYTKDWRYNNLHLYSTGIEFGLHFYFGRKN
ncbi:MAG: hypothetical protein ACXVPU_10380 [Bacteroidia bacterium]